MATELVCVPLFPVFCANVHVSCAGRSAVETHPFTVRISRAGTVIEVEGQDAYPVSTAMSRSGVVLRPELTRDWVRIDPEMNFSQRIYRGGTALMSIGTCKALRQVPDATR